MTTLTNWSGSISFTPADHRTLASEEEIVAAVAEARERGRTVRPAGSRHSSTPLYATDEWLLSVDDHAGLLGHDSDALTATLASGTTLEQAGRALGEVGLAMENFGDVNYQTIAGAISTGTHGSGLRFGTLSTTLVGGRLVTADGNVLPFGTEAGRDEAGEPHPDGPRLDDPRPDDLLRAVQVSLGSLGVFSSMTLRVEPALDLRRRNWMTHVDWVAEHFDELVSSNRHMDFYWYPRSDEAQVRILNEPGEHPDWSPPPDGLRHRGDNLKDDETGPNWDILTNDRDLRFDEMEYMFPYADAMEVFAQVRQRIKQRHRHEVGWRVLVRTIAGDDGLISTCHGRDTVSIALLHNNELPHQEYFADMEPFMLELGGRPHWGKKHTLDHDRLAGLYPRWQDFLDIRRRLDSDGLFLNPYLRTLFGEDA